MARNKVEIVNGSTTTVLLDVSGTTATPATVLSGYTFTQADGTQATGTMEQASGGIQEVATVSEVQNIVSTEPVGTIFKYTGTTTSEYEQGEFYMVVDAPNVNLTVEYDYSNYSESGEVYVNGTNVKSFAGEVETDTISVSYGATVEVECGGTSASSYIKVDGVTVDSGEYASYTFTITQDTTVEMYVG